MGIESALVDHILADATVSAEIATRFYPDVAPQGADFPRATYQVISTDHPQHAAGGAGLAESRVQLDYWAKTALERRTGIDALRERLQGFTGAMGVELLTVKSVTVDGPSNTYEPPIHGDESGIYRGRFEAVIWYAESVPSH